MEEVNWEIVRKEKACCKRRIRLASYNILRGSMYEFDEIIKQEKKYLQRKIKEISKNQRSHPKGSLIVRRSGNKYKLFSRIKHNGKIKELAVDNNPELIRRYINKEIDNKQEKKAVANLAMITKLERKYENIESYAYAENLPKAYRIAMSRLNRVTNNCLNYIEHNASDKHHKQLASCGIYVRSKNELFICNSLDESNIKFKYEEKITINGRDFYPDFTIYMPNGDIIIWEHLGMLGDFDYFKKNAVKIYEYFKMGFLPGKNLILTYNDLDDKLDTLEIKRIITEQLAPYF